MIEIKFKNNSNNPDPEYATNGSAGFDIRANLTDEIILKSGEWKLIPTGLYFELPDNMELQIRSRSGLAYKYGVSVLNGIGTIDSDYLGEIGVILINHGKCDFVINHGDRIAQGVLSETLTSITKLVQIDGELTKQTKRSSNGFGSTGVK